MYELIRTRFEKAIQHYDNNAVAQKIISTELFALIQGSCTAEKILEIGCGTGNLSENLLKLYPKRLLLNDICKDYVPVIESKLAQSNHTNISFICADAQEIIGKDVTEKFNLIASSSAIQWMQNPLQFLIACKKMLIPGGILAISTFGPDNMREIAAINGTGLQYNSLEEIREALDPHYQLLHLSSSEIILTFKEPIDVLRHIKFTGVNGIHCRSWTKKDLHHFTETYNHHFRNAQGLCTLTYKPVFLLCKPHDTKD